MEIIKVLSIEVSIPIDKKYDQKALYFEKEDLEIILKYLKPINCFGFFDKHSHECGESCEFQKDCYEMGLKNNPNKKGEW